MQKRTREIIALVLLAVLAVGVLCVMGWYMLVGHSWNVAASNIDDSIGQMRGYTVFLVKGNKPISVASASDESVALGANAVTVDAQVLDETSPDDDHVSHPSSPGSRTQIVSNSSDSSHVAQNGSGDTQSNNTGANALSQIVSDTVENAAGKTIRTIEELIMEYQDKGADVFVIESADAGAYDKPVTFENDTQLIGVFKVADPARPAAVKVKTKLLDRVNTDFNILVTNDTSLEGTALRDVDMIVFNQTDADYQDGRFDGSSYCIDTPLEGQVEAVIMSPSGVISSKVIAL